MIVSSTMTDAITRATGISAELASDCSIAGGCISSARRVELTDGRGYFVKQNDSAPPDMFPREADGLRALGDAGAIAVAQPVVAGDTFLVLEWIESGQPVANFSETFGEQLATLHRTTQTTRCGFEHDNYIGSTPQPNGWMEDWISFWRERRIGFQLKRARERGLSDRSFDALGNALLERLDTLLAGHTENACLLHGDLWGGNYLVNHAGVPVLIDPAAYYGAREADLAMTTLFGGFESAFYDAYEATWPLEPESEQRIGVYKLYHLLNHLNLFGGSYRQSCVSIMRALT